MRFLTLPGTLLRGHRAFVVRHHAAQSRPKRNRAPSTPSTSSTPCYRAWPERIRTDQFLKLPTNRTHPRREPSGARAASRQGRTSAKSGGQPLPRVKAVGHGRPDRCRRATAGGHTAVQTRTERGKRDGDAGDVEGDDEEAEEGARRATTGRPTGVFCCAALVTLLTRGRLRAGNPAHLAVFSGWSSAVKWPAPGR